MRKSWMIGGIVAVAVLALVVYFGSPFFAVQSLVSAARHGDGAKLEALVDFPAVRENLKSQMTQYLTKKMTTDPDMRNNPFAALGMALATTFVDKAVDAYVTPDSISNLAKGQKPAIAPQGSAEDTTIGAPAATERQEKSSGPKISYRYVTLDLVEASVTNTTDPNQVVRFDFERRNLFTWKLFKIDIGDLLTEAANESNTVGA
jgi:hypothetical protein